MCRHVAVSVPIVRRADVDQLDEADAPFRQAAANESTASQSRLFAPARMPYSLSVASVSSDKSIASGASRCMPNAVSNERMRASRARVGAALRDVLLVGFCKQIQFKFLQLRRRHSTALNVGNRVLTGNDLACLDGILAESRCPTSGRRRTGVCGATTMNEGRFADSPCQAVTDPSPDARPREIPRAAMHAERALVVIRVVRLHRPDNAQVVDDFAHVWKRSLTSMPLFPPGLNCPVRPS